MYERGVRADNCDRSLVAKMPNSSYEKGKSGGQRAFAEEQAWMAVASY